MAFIGNLESFKEKLAQRFNFFDIFSEDDLPRMLLEQSLAIGAQCLNGLWFSVVNTLHSEVQSYGHLPTIIRLNSMLIKGLIKCSQKLKFLVIEDVYAACPLNPAHLLLLPLV